MHHISHKSEHIQLISTDFISSGVVCPGVTRAGATQGVGRGATQGVGRGTTQGVGRVTGGHLEHLVVVVESLLHVQLAVGA